MKRKSSSPFIYVVLITAIVILGVRHFHIKGFRVIAPDVLYASGQPRGMDYTRLLYRYHISTIVNVRSASEQREKNWHNEELIWTKENAVQYIEIPIEKHNYFPDEQEQNKFISIMNDRTNLPVLIHGGGNDKRVAMMVAVWLEKTQGCTIEQTVSTIGKILGKRQLTDSEKHFLESLKK
jgi:protein tyrosine/serine phosphatase